MSESVWFSILLALLVLIPTPSWADDFTKHVTLKRYPPGSFRIKYGGLRGFVINQMKTQFRNLHRDYLDLNHPHDYKLHTRSILEMRFRQAEIDAGGTWYTRHWWESMPELKGGAPKIPIKVYRGPQKVVIDVGIAYLTSDLRFKMREYTVQITKSKRISSWNLRIKPSLNFSSTQIIREGKLSLFFQYYYRGFRTMVIEVYTSYAHKYRRVSLGFNFYHLKW